MSHQEERPTFDKGSGLWHQSTRAVEDYIEILEKKIVDSSDNDDTLKLENAQLNVCCGILEKRIKQLTEELSDVKDCQEELTRELDAIAHNRELTRQWAQGLIEN